MGLLGLFSRKRHERAGFSLYTAAVRAARDPFYYAELEVPDTMDGRFDMIGLYTFLLIDRLHREAAVGKALAQAVFDAMFLDMDHTLRELGVGDITVGRKNKAMWEALNGRRQAYEAPVAAGDVAALAEAIGRNVWRGSPPQGAPLRLAAITLDQHRQLAAQGLDGLLAGRVAFLVPEATVPSMSEMERPVPIDRIGTGGLVMTVDAGPDELAAIATRLMIPAVARLSCAFELKRLENAIIAAHGRLAAEVTQTCVVSLDEFPQRIDEPFDVLFVPAGTESDDPDPDAPDELPYPAGAIDLGEAAIEQLALSLDPYPRKAGLEEPAEEETTAPHPFAALAALRRPQ